MKLMAMIDAMSIAAAGFQNYAAQFAKSATKIAASGGDLDPADMVGMIEAKAGFEANVKSFSAASSMYGTLLDIVV